MKWPVCSRVQPVFVIQAVWMKNTVFVPLLGVAVFRTAARAGPDEQHTAQDSLYAIWKDPRQSDSIRVRAYKNYLWDGYLFSNPDPISRKH